MYLPVAKRIRIDPVTDCWIWTGAHDSQGYGNVAFAGTTYSAHRLVFSILVGPIPDGLAIDHLCRVRACVNPDHLEAVTPQENSRRIRKLTDSEISNLLERYDRGDRVVDIASALCIRSNQVCYYAQRYLGDRYPRRQRRQVPA